MIINNSFIISNIILVLVVILIGAFFSKIYNSYFNPLTIFTVIWTIILFNVFIILGFDLSKLIYFIIAFLSFMLPTIIFLRKFPSNTTIPLSRTTSHIERLKLILIICVVARFLQLGFDLFVFLRIGGEFSSILGDVQALRFRYLLRNSNLIQDIIVNLLNYFSELGIILSAIYYKNKKGYMYLLISIFLALSHSILTFSKFSFLIDIIFIVSILTIYNAPKAEKKNIKQNKKILIIIGICVVLLFNIISNQRGYGLQESKIPGVDSVLLYKSISYFIGPTIAFLNIFDLNITHGHGIMTFTPFLQKVLNFPEIGTINIGFFESNVYTLFGSLYIDFGYLGSILMIFIFSLILNYLFIKLKYKNNIGLLSIYCILNSALCLSFFDWIGRQTFFWLFPIFVYLIDLLFIKKKSRNRGDVNAVSECDNTMS